MNEQEKKQSPDTYIVVNGTVLSTQDPYYYEKLLLHKPDDPYILYALAYKYKLQAKEYKDINEKTYLRKKKLSHHYFQLALESGYHEAKNDIEQINSIPGSKPSSHVIKRRKIYRWISALLIALILLFLTFDSILTVNNWIYPNDGMVEQLPYSLKGENPISTFEFISQQGQKDLLTPNASTPLKIKNQTSNVIQQNQDMFSLLFLRSALYHYVRNTGKFPLTFQTLMGSFPNNYISSIPPDTAFFKNQIESEFDNSGGWVYSPPNEFLRDDYSDPELRILIKKSLKPNFHYKFLDNSEFTPLEIHINKSKHTLNISSGHVVFGAFNVGLGKNNLTPTGVFSITKRVAFPNYHISNPTYIFGTRGLELSNSPYAIHGTFDKQSIGANLSKGCIRLSNSDVEALFAITPLYTQVLIHEEANKGTHPLGNEQLSQNTVDSHKLYESYLVGVEENKESAPETIFHWQH